MKLRAYIALCFYVIATSGLVVNLHFCCGGLAEVGIFGELDPCQCNHEKHSCSESGDCCDFESIYLNVDEDHKIPPTTLIGEWDATLVASITPFIIVPKSNEEAAEMPIRAGPLPSAPAKYISLCSLVLYG